MPSYFGLTLTARYDHHRDEGDGEDAGLVETDDLSRFFLSRHVVLLTRYWSRYSRALPQLGGTAYGGFAVII